MSKNFDIFGLVWAKAKANAAQGIREMVGIATDKEFRENRKEKHSGDETKNGEIVQITYTSYLTKELTCLCFAYRKNGKWLYDNGKFIDEISDDNVVTWEIAYHMDVTRH